MPEESHCCENITNNAILLGLNNCSPQKDGKNSCRLMRGDVGKLKCKGAFTLAETLITLGIIGVVAAITLPTLVANYQKKVYATRLKKEVSFIQNSFKKIVADEGVSDFASTSVVEPVVLKGDNGQDVNSYKIDFEKYANSLKLQKYNIPSSPSVEYLKNSFAGFIPENSEGYVLNDGSCLTFSYRQDNLGSFESGNVFFVDINCDKKPNIIGLDRFGFATVLDNPEKFDVFIVDNPNYANQFRWYCGEFVKSAALIEPRSHTQLVVALYCGYAVIGDGYEIKY